MRKGKLLTKLLAMSVAPLLCLGSLGVATYAWFTASRRAELGVNEIKVKAPEFPDTFRLYAYNGNSPSGYTDYAYLSAIGEADQAATIGSGVSFSSQFSEITGSEYRLENLFPKSCYLFALFFEKGEDFNSFSLSLTASCYGEASEGTGKAVLYNIEDDGSEGLNHGQQIVLASAIDVYTKTLQLSDSEYTADDGVLQLSDANSEAANAFITTDMGSGDPTLGQVTGRLVEDRFDYFQNRDDDDTSAITRQVVEETAMSTSACLVLIQVEFSDFPETHMSPLDESDPSSGADYWEFDPSSSLSTPYQGLPFSIEELTLRGNR